MEVILHALAEDFIFAMIGVCFLAAIGFRAVTSMVATTARERSRREIAAYIAEGSLTPDQGSADAGGDQLAAYVRRKR